MVKLWDRHVQGNRLRSAYRAKLGPRLRLLQSSLQLNHPLRLHARALRARGLPLDAQFADLGQRAGAGFEHDAFARAEPVDNVALQCDRPRANLRLSGCGGSRRRCRARSRASTRSPSRLRGCRRSRQSGAAVDVAVLLVLVGEEAPGEALALHLVTQVGIGHAEVERAIAGVEDLFQRLPCQVPYAVQVVAEPFLGQGVHAGAVGDRAEETAEGFGL